MKDSIKFLGQTLRLLRTFDDRTAARPATVKVYSHAVQLQHPLKPEVHNKYSITIHKKIYEEPSLKDNEFGDCYYSVIITAPTLVRNFSGFLLPLQEQFARAWLKESLEEKILKVAF